MPTFVAFEKSFAGRVIRARDAEYDDARAVWNRMIDRRPALIARCANTDDVVRALRFGRDHDLPISVRGGGHNVTGNAVVDGGLMIDLSAMKAARVDAARRVIVTGPGLTWKDFDLATLPFGLATTGGIVSSTGVAGLTLGGGHGWLMRRHGLTCDNLLSVQVVTADGRRVTASADENPDLFWGVRGGGGNFGIVTAFEFRLHPVTHGAGGVRPLSAHAGRRGLPRLPRVRRRGARRADRRRAHHDVVRRHARDRRRRLSLRRPRRPASGSCSRCEVSARRSWTRSAA